MRRIEDMTRELVKAYPFLSDSEKARFQEEKPVIGKCPRCGGNVREGKKTYACDNKDCAFACGRTSAFFEEPESCLLPRRSPQNS